MTDQLIQSNQKVWRRVTVPGLMSAYVTVETASGDPTFDWFGPKIPLALWRSILSFFKWSQDTHHCETQVRLFLNATTGQWRAWAFPQEKGGMTTKEIQGKEADEQRAAIGSGYQEFGSVHHHCSMSAFQSGTDHTDESGRPGLHLTVGNMNDPVYSIHSRALFVANGGKTMYKDMALDQWFESPAWFTTLPKEVLEMLGAEARHNAVQRELTRPSKDPFPEAWKTNLIERKWEAYNQTGPNGFYSGIGGGAGGAGGGYGWRATEMDKEIYLKKILKVMEDHNLVVDDIEEMMSVMLDLHEVVMKSPRIMWGDCETIVAEAVRDGTLEKLAAEEELKAEQKADGKSPIVANGMTQEELDRMDVRLGRPWGV